MPLDQDGVEVRPIEQLTGGSEFNEVFFTGARTDADLVVGEPGDGWRVAMGLLGFERGVSILAQLVGFARELDGVVAVARENGAIDDPVLRDRLAALKAELEVMRFTALRSLSGVTGGEDSSAGGGAASIFKLVWADWHKRLGEVAMDVLGADGLVADAAAPYDLDDVAAALPVLPRRHASTAAATRCSATSWPSACSACPASRRGTAVTTHRPEQPAPDYVPGPRPARRQGRRGDRRGRVPASAPPSSAGRSRRARRPSSSATPTSAGSPRPRRRWPRSSAPTGSRQLVCDVTDEAQVQALLDAADELGGVDVMVNNAGLGGTAERARDDRRAVGQGPRHHPDRHLPLRPRGRASGSSRPARRA